MPIWGPDPTPIDNKFWLSDLGRYFIVLRKFSRRWRRHPSQMLLSLPAMSFPNVELGFARSARRHRQQAARFALPFGPVARLDQVQKPGGTDNEARGRRGLGER